MLLLWRDHNVAAVFREELTERPGVEVDIIFVVDVVVDLLVAAGGEAQWFLVHERLQRRFQADALHRQDMTGRLQRRFNWIFFWNVTFELDDLLESYLR